MLNKPVYNNTYLFLLPSCYLLAENYHTLTVGQHKSVNIYPFHPAAHHTDFQTYRSVLCGGDKLLPRETVGAASVERVQGLPVQARPTREAKT